MMKATQVKSVYGKTGKPECELNPMNDWEAIGICEQTSDELYLFFFDAPYLGITILTFPDLLL